MLITVRSRYAEKSQVTRRFRPRTRSRGPFAARAVELWEKGARLRRRAGSVARAGTAVIRGARARTRRYGSRIRGAQQSERRQRVAAERERARARVCTHKIYRNTSPSLSPFER